MRRSGTIGKAGLQAWLASWLTQRAFCEREQLKQPTFDYWCRRVKPDAGPARRHTRRKTVPPMTLVPVQVTTSDLKRLTMDLLLGS